MHRTIPLSYVISAKVKDQSRGWKFICPSCGGNDCWYTPDNGFAFCFNCGAGFTVESAPLDGVASAQQHQVSNDPISIESIRFLYRLLVSYYIKALSSYVRTYLYQRGLTDEYIRIFQLGYCPNKPLSLYGLSLARQAGVGLSSGYPVLAGRITIPYFVGSEVVDLRGRSIDGQEPKYMSLAHSTRRRGVIYPYNVDRARLLTKDKSYVIVTEGEFKAMLADMHGFPTIAFPGMNSRRQIPEDLLKLPLILVFDTDKDAQHRVDASMQRLVQTTPAAWYVVSLPLLDGASKMDIDTFLLHPKGGERNFRYFVESAVPWSTYVRLRSF